MAIEAINTQAMLLRSMDQMRSEAIAPPSDQLTSARVNFGQVMLSALNAVDQQQHNAARLQTAVETGKSDDLVGAMVASQKAGLSFSALVQVRNRLQSGFDEIMRMPV
jgi:flagellar hook-basal body complex protein FliE